ncbi:MAG: transposase, partial [Chloroflexi bacterium]|nr:transposase [Chloroflexota bacterium]
MPVRPLTRDQAWLVPPSLDDLVPDDHAVRFVPAFVDAFTRVEWQALGIAPEGDALGAPAYAAPVLLSVWLYGFMTGVRSSRKLEAACREQVPYLWLTGCQYPDHTTLWRFYQEHRQGLRTLLRRTVRAAVRLGLVDLALQAVDGTKIAGNAAKERTYDAAGMQRLLARTEAAIADLEAQNTTGGEAPVPRLPQALAQAKALRARVQEALAAVTAEEGPTWVNLTAGQARLMKSRQGIVPGYNAQAMSSRLAPSVA